MLSKVSMHKKFHVNHSCTYDHDSLVSGQVLEKVCTILETKISTR
jgi:hypothetical protein